MHRVSKNRSLGLVLWKLIIILEIRVLVLFSHIPKENSSKIALNLAGRNFGIASLNLQAKLAQSEYTFKMNINSLDT